MEISWSVNFYHFLCVFFATAKRKIECDCLIFWYSTYDKIRRIMFAFKTTTCTALISAIVLVFFQSYCAILFVLPLVTRPFLFQQTLLRVLTSDTVVPQTFPVRGPLNFLMMCVILNCIEIHKPLEKISRITSVPRSWVWESLDSYGSMQ